MQLAARSMAFLILPFVLIVAQASAGERIAWEAGPPAVGFRHGSFPAGGGSSARPLLVADLRGQTMSFSPADTALYAVFLAGDLELTELRQLLHRTGVSAFLASADGIPVAAAVPAPTALDLVARRLRIGPNGSVEVHADEGRTPGKDRLAVINAAGEILTVRPLWHAAAPLPDVAVARRQAGRKPAAADPAERRSSTR
jgi:hypothetical protein